MEGRVDFDHVTFHYEQGNPVLHDVSFTALPGQQIALVGHSGSGKSTIASLILRFYDVESGVVRLDGIDVRDIRLRSLRRHVAVVLQEPVLFSGTIQENILYGNPTASDAEVMEAAKAANAFDFICALPNGFETEVGERGSQLSAGQRQRITLARAFLRDPRILILDEATSALDAESEGLIQEAMRRLVQGRTTLVIAHQTGHRGEGGLYYRAPRRPDRRTGYACGACSTRGRISRLLQKAGRDHVDPGSPGTTDRSMRGGKAGEGALSHQAVS